MSKTKRFLNFARSMVAHRRQQLPKTPSPQTLIQEQHACFDFQLYGPVKRTRVVHTWRFSCFENFEHNIVGTTDSGGLFLALGDAGCFTHILVTNTPKPLVAKDRVHKVDVLFCADYVELYLDGVSVASSTLDQIKLKPMRVFLTPPSWFERIFGRLAEHHSYTVAGFPVQCFNQYIVSDVEVLNANCK